MGKYIKLFNTHSEYETYINGNDKILPNVSYCEDNDDVHYNNREYNFSASDTNIYIPIEDSCCNVKITKTVSVNDYLALVFPFDITSKKQFEDNFGTTKYSILTQFYQLENTYLMINWVEKSDFPILAGTPFRVQSIKALSVMSFNGVHLHSELPKYTLLNSNDSEEYPNYFKYHYIIENYYYKHILAGSADADKRGYGIARNTGQPAKATETGTLGAFAWKIDAIEHYVNEGAEVRPKLNFEIRNGDLYLKDNGSIINIYGTTTDTYIDINTTVRSYTDDTYIPYDFSTT